jgi:hypothetical protein
MRLADLRRAAVKHSSRVVFQSAEGMQCVIDEHGLARIPNLKRATQINLEREMQAAREFRVETDGAAQSLSREQLERWVGVSEERADNPED